MRKRYECNHCHSIIETDEKVNLKTLKCLCGNNKFILLSRAFTNKEYDTIIKTQQEKYNELRIKLNEVYELIQEVIQEYVELSESKMKLLSVWILGTYFHKYFPTYPILFLNAMKSSAKTRTLKIISALSNGGEGFVTNNLSESSLFRHPTNHILCIDEIENLAGKDKQTLRELLNSCYKRGARASRVRKIKKDNQEVFEKETYELFFPVALANIWGIEEVLESRAITLILEKSNNPYYTKKIENFENNEKIHEIKRRMEEINAVMPLNVVLFKKGIDIERWNNWISDKYKRHNNIYNIYNNNYTKQHTTTINKEIDKELIIQEEFFLKIDSSEIDGRMLELYFPLFITVNILGEFEDFLKIAKINILEKQEDEFAESKDIALIEFIANHGKGEYTPLKDITSHFRLFVGDTGRDEENWVNEKWLGRALKRLNLVKRKKREASGRFVITDFEKAKFMLQMFGNKNEQVTT